MAKVKPAFALMEMEDDVGFKVGPSGRADDAGKRFYSDLRPVPDDTHGLTEKNYQEFVRRKHDKDSSKITARLLPRPGQREASIPAWRANRFSTNVCRRLSGAPRTESSLHMKTPSDSTGFL